MQRHNLKRKTKLKTSNQVGRGGTRGKTSGRGTKGQNARAGHKNRPELRDFIKRFPKMRGRGKNSNTSIQEKAIALSLTLISQAYEAGAEVSPKTLLEKKLVVIRNGKVPKVKILGGNTDKKLNFSGVSATVSAKVAIEKAGGKIA